MNLQTVIAPLAFISLVGNSSAALVINAPQVLIEEVRVQAIIVSDDAGANAATYLGTLSQTTAIEGLVDQIWAQAGIDVTFLPTVGYNSTFALEGTPGFNDPRPTLDLNTIVNQAALAGGVLHTDANVINMFFVDIAAGFTTLSANTAAGLAFVGGNGITQYVGANLLSFPGGRDVVASVISHEIGHNLGLPHIAEAENLMQAGGSDNQGERLNNAQITTALNSSFSVAIPEQSSVILSLVGLLVLGRRRR